MLIGTLKGGRMNRGGKREGAGRKPAPEGTTKAAYSTKLDPLVIEYLRSRPNAAATVEAALKRSKDFREWANSR